jgi:hypothetical protein
MLIAPPHKPVARLYTPRVWMPTKRRMRRARLAMPAFVQSSQGGNLGFGADVAFAGDNTAGNLLFVSCFGGFGGVTCHDDLNGPYTQVGVTIDPGGGIRSTSVFFFPGCAAGANTVHIVSGGFDFINVLIGEYSGVDTAVALDDFSTATGNSAALDSGPFNTGAPNGLMIGVYNAINAGLNPTDGNAVREAAGAFSWEFGDQVVPAATAGLHATATCPAGLWTCFGISFLSATLTPGGTFPQKRGLQFFPG